MSRRPPVARSAALLAVAGAPVAFQLGGGLHDAGMIEEWGVYSYFDAAGVVFWAPSDPQLTTQSIRPLTVAPHSVAYLLDPNGFVGLQLVQAAAMGLQGVAMLLLLRALGLGDAAAIAGSVLFTLFPAFDASFTLRSVHMHWALAFLTLGLWLLVRLGSASRSGLAAIAMIVCVTTSLMLYEAGYVLVALAPALLLVRAGRPAWRRIAVVGGLWYAGPFLNGLHIVWLLASGQRLYQKDITQTSHRTSGEVVRLFRRILAGTWSPLTPPHGFAVGAVSLATIAVAGTAIVLVAVRSTGGDEAEAGPVARASLAIGAIICAPVSALVYWPQPAHLVDPLRIFSVAGLPLSVGLAGGLSLLPRAWPRAAAALAGVVLVALSAQAHRAYWHTRSEQQSHVLGAITAELPASVPAGTAIAVVDADGYLSRDYYALPDLLLQDALRYVRHDPGLVVHNCAAPGAAVTAGFTERCDLGAPTATLGSERLPRSRVIAIDLVPGARGAPEPAVHLTGRERRLVPCAAFRTCARGTTGATAVPVVGP